jgi:hypothetical protein
MGYAVLGFLGGRAAGSWILIRFPNVAFLEFPVLSWANWNGFCSKFLVPRLGFQGVSADSWSHKHRLLIRSSGFLPKRRQARTFVRVSCPRGGGLVRVCLDLGLLLGSWGWGTAGSLIRFLPVPKWRQRGASLEFTVLSWASIGVAITSCRCFYGFFWST